MGIEEVVQQARGYDLIIINTSTPTVVNDAGIAERLKDHYPASIIGFVGSPYCDPSG